MNRVCAALLGLATLAGPGCVSAPPAGTSLSPAERSAGQAWDRARAEPGANRGDIYGSGFRAGFVAATGGGGTTAPDDWRAGFRHGTAAAFEGAAREPKARSAAALPAFPTATPERPQTFSPAPKSFFVSEPVPPAVAARTGPPTPVPPAPDTGSNTSDRSAATRAAPPAPAPKVALAPTQDRPEPTRPPVVVVEAVSAAPAEEFGPWRPSKPLPPPSVVRDP